MAVHRVVVLGSVLHAWLEIIEPIADLKHLSAGVAGLTTALLLSKDSHYDVTIAAKHMPGDSDIEYASPWAGANYAP